jgi:RHS repeat-associated protein
VILSIGLSRGPIRIAIFVRLLVCLFLTSPLIFGETRAFAQDPPDIAQGLNPASTYHGSDIDFVDMLTGRLNLHIPLVVDHSQRGNLNFTYSLYFSGTTWYSNMWCTRTQCFPNWTPAKGTARGITFGTDGHLGSGPDARCTIKICGYNASAISVSSDDGGSHQMGTITTTPPVEESIDGSQIRSSTNSAHWEILTNRDGIQFDRVSFDPISGAFTNQTEDANGNELIFQGNITANSPTTMTDTLGRKWTQTIGSNNVSGCPVPAVSSTLWDIPGLPNINSGVREFKFCYSNISIKAIFGPWGEYDGTGPAMTGVVLPDGSTWRFDYNSYGDPSVVHLPTGGTITYQWGLDDNYQGSDKYEVVTQRTVFDGVSSSSWQYYPLTGTSRIGTRVTDPFGNDTLYDPLSSRVIQKIQYYTGSYTNGTLLKTVTKTYQDLPNPYPNDVQIIGFDPQLPLTTTTTWQDGQTSQDQIIYDCGYFTFTDTNPGGKSYISTCPAGATNPTYGLAVSDVHYDYGNGSVGPALSGTNTNFLALSNSNYLTANILSLPSSVITTDGTGHKCAETDYGYDASAQIVSSGVTMQHVSAPSPGILGNLTSITRQLSSTPCQPNASWTPLAPSKHYVYDTGMLQVSLDSLTNPTTYSYSGTDYGAYPTTVTNGLNQSTTYTYDFNTGLMTSLKDANNQTTSFQYDNMLRRTSAVYPDGGQETFTPIYTSGYFAGASLSKKINSSQTLFSTQLFDGLGRLKETQLTSDPGGTTYTDLTYDAVGRKYKVWNPTRCYPAQTNCGEATWGFITYNYDPLNRVTQATNSDSSTALTSYTGRATSMQDEGNGTQRVQRISQVDGLGRLTSSCEVSSTTQLGTGGTPTACAQDIAGAGFLTNLGYDGLSNLTSVSQGGYLPRSFSYDSLSRLTMATNPESGTLSYTYDASGNLITKTSPAPNQTGSATVSLSYCYDALDRITSKAYTNQSCPMTAPAATYAYDLSSVDGLTIQNPVGRRVKALVLDSTWGSSVVNSYDQMGRINNQWRCIPRTGNCSTSSPYYWNVAYTYDLNGDITTLTDYIEKYTNSYDSAGRLTQVTSSVVDANHPSPLLTGVQYNAAGEETLATLGNGINEVLTYDKRLRLLTEAATKSSTTVYSLGLSYTPNGNVLTGNDSVNGNWTYGYDAFNRLASATATGQSYTYDYDRFGNRWHQNGPHSLSVSFSGNNNRIDGLSYDAAGNLLSDGGVHTYRYDAENRIVDVDNNPDLYAYDADGLRTFHHNNGGWSEPLYDLAGHMIVDIPQGSRSEIYPGGRHLGTYTNNTTYFHHADWLGTERARSTVSGSSCETITSLPFGDAQTTTGSCSDPSPMHFTGKERDSESGLDNFGARYDSSQYGRFMSADPNNEGGFDNEDDPQAWNGYAYARNNPLIYTDEVVPPLVET